MTATPMTNLCPVHIAARQWTGDDWSMVWRSSCGPALTTASGLIRALAVWRSGFTTAGHLSASWRFKIGAGRSVSECRLALQHRDHPICAIDFPSWTGSRSDNATPSAVHWRSPIPRALRLFTVGGALRRTKSH